MKTLLILLLSVTASLAFELQDGETVAFLGDTFIEREQYEGWIELAMTTHFSDRDIKFRNLGWSADTPAGKSRAGLSLLQAGLEPEDEGWKQLLNQLSTYKPDVIVLGYGMAASLPGGSSPELFRKNLERLLDAAPEATGKPVRFLILGAPPRFAMDFDGPDELPARRASLAAIDSVLKQTADGREIPFVRLADLEQEPGYSQNGIHLTSAGYRAVARRIEKSLGWPTGLWDKGEKAEALRQHILRKNEWFFNRSRPANMAYIFGFRAKEQGNNAVEIPRYDALIAEEDAAIAKMRDLSEDTIVPPLPVRTNSDVAENKEQPKPDFSVADGFEVTLWAENPMLQKPTQINFDPQGRLWVASSGTYPMIEVGQSADDRITILEDTNGDGTADKATAFADGMMMPTAVLPDATGGAYAAQSTDLLHFSDTNGDGKADEKTRVLSGFGTEDTHHNLHTLRRGPEGKIWMAQSVYTRSDIETPHAVVRLKSGGVFRFDPRDQSLEIVYRGLWNTWGHQFDEYGQSFLTDGAGFKGITWGMPGAMYEAYAKAPRILDSISPGAYPKFCGLEIIGSAHFPRDWQGNLITCDFRAHRIVRFSITEDGAGFVTQELDDLLRSDSVSFRPIDVKTGPDGALYVADWSNPIINHGEVDFRDPRRDREHGRIWRIAKKNSPSAKKPDFEKLDTRQLIALLASGDRFEREQATAILASRPIPEYDLSEKTIVFDDPREIFADTLASRIQGSKIPAAWQWLAVSEDPKMRAMAIRMMSAWIAELETKQSYPTLKKAITDKYPAVRREAILTLSQIPGPESLDIALGALDHPTDRFIEYALWLSIQSHGKSWIKSGQDLEGKEKRLAFVIANLPPGEATTALAEVFPATLPQDGSGLWLKIGLELGDARVISKIFQQAVSSGFDEATTAAALDGITKAVSERQIRPDGDISKLNDLLQKENPAAIRLAGTLADPSSLPTLIELADKPSTRDLAVDALGNFNAEPAKQKLNSLASAHTPPATNIVLALARNAPDSALKFVPVIVSGDAPPATTQRFWQELLTVKGISPRIVKLLTDSPLSPEAAALALRSIPDIANNDALLNILRTQAGDSLIPDYTPEKIAEIAASSEKGDPHRGELIYRQPALACTACHAIAGVGGLTGPDLTSIGASAPLDYLVESIVKPGAKVKEGYHSVIIETKDGKSINGRLIRSSEGSTVIRDAVGNETTVPDSMIAKQIDAGSLMPGGLIDSLNPQQTADLFAFLSQLGKPGDFSANDSNSPKIYAVIARTPKTMDAAAKGDASLSWVPINATVNGTLLVEDVWNAKLVGGGTMIGTRLQLASPATVEITFANGFKPSELYINGKPATTATAELPAGIHSIVLRADRLKDPLRIITNTGTFLPEW